MALDATAYSAIAVAAATVTLVIVTYYYARQTRHTVDEMREQTEEIRLQRTSAAAAARERSDAERIAVRSALISELRQLVALLTLSGPGSNHTILPSAAWQASFAYPNLLPANQLESLFEIYGEVARLNGMTELLLSMSSRERPGRMDSEASGIGLDRHTSGELLARTIQTCLDSLSLI
jgi:hypothetical protein